MVGKPNLPSGVDARKDLKGAAMTTGGLTPLDEEREASMADEGGASGAFMENEEGVSPVELENQLRRDGEERLESKSASGITSFDFLKDRRVLFGIGLSVVIVAAATFARKRFSDPSNKKVS